MKYKNIVSIGGAVNTVWNISLITLWSIVRFLKVGIDQINNGTNVGSICIAFKNSYFNNAKL